MTSAARRDCAFFLAAVAVLGLVITPLLHAEEHGREGREEDAEAAALAAAWNAGSTDPLDALAFALAHAEDLQEPRPEDGHHRHGHSHGPDGAGPHGSGALAHLGVALHAAPRLPHLARAAEAHAAPAALRAQLPAALPYLLPEWPQGPPAGC